MNKDITHCAALFCDLSNQCRRKEHEGRPVDDTLSFMDFSLESLHINDMQELVCDDRL